MKIRKQRRAPGKRRASRRRKRTFNYTVPLSLRRGPVSNRALASSRRPVLPRLRLGAAGFTWSKVLASLILSAMVALLVWFFVDPRFYVYGAEVRGDTLVSAADVYRASGLDTMSIFYVNRGQVADNIGRQVVGVVGVQIDCQPPARVHILIREQEAAFVWHTMGTALLVDGEGQVLKVDDGPHEGLLSVQDLDNRTLGPGDQVDRVALNTVDRLHSLLPDVWTFEYSQVWGVSLLDARGWRIRFGDDESLVEKVATMHAIVKRIVSTGESVKLIDLRFLGSPYYE